MLNLLLLGYYNKLGISQNLYKVGWLIYIVGIVTINAVTMLFCQKLWLHYNLIYDSFLHSLSPMLCYYQLKPRLLSASQQVMKTGHFWSHISIALNSNFIKHITGSHGRGGHRDYISHWQNKYLVTVSIHTCMQNSFYRTIRLTNAPVKLTVICTLLLPVYLGLDNQKLITHSNTKKMLHHCCNRS